MELAYKKLMEEYGLKMSDLPEDAVEGVRIVEDIAKGIRSAEKRGKNISNLTYRKLKINDKWLVREIIDFKEGTEKNEEDIPFEKEEVLKEIPKDEIKPSDQVEQVDKSKGNKVNLELAKLIEDGNETLSAAELKKLAPVTYEIILESYKAGEENGVQTNSFLVKETETEVFKIEKL
jgi:hypothetical protein